MKELLNLNKYERINELSVILTNNMKMIPKKLRLISLPSKEILWLEIILLSVFD